MDIVQLISFLFVMLAMAMLSRKRSQEKKQAQYPEALEEGDERQQKQNLKHFLKSLEIDMDDDEEIIPPLEEPVKAAAVPPPPPVKLKPAAYEPPQRLVQDDHYRLKDSFENYYPSTTLEKKIWQTSIDNREKEYSAEKIVSPDLKSSSNPYNVMITARTSRGRDLIGSLVSPKDMIVYQEIMNPPVSLRPPR